MKFYPRHTMKLGFGLVQLIAAVSEGLIYKFGVFSNNRLQAALTLKFVAKLVTV